MNKTSTIVRHSLSEIRAMRERGEDQASPDAPEAESQGEDFWKSGRSTASVLSERVRINRQTEEFFQRRAAGASSRPLGELLDEAPNCPPDPGDEFED